MRLKILALFFCAGVVGMCQSATPAPKTSARVDESRHGTQQRTDCKKASSDFSFSSVAPQQGERRFEVPAWSWDDAQVAAKSAIHSPFLIPPPKSCPSLASNAESIYDQGLYRQRLQAKLEPIPTEWPNAKLEAIPTDWPNLKVVPLTSRLGTATTRSTLTK
jgi:hypothetical protein